MIVDWITGILYYFVFTPLALYWVYYIYKNGNKYTMNNYVYFMFIVCSFWFGHLFYHASYKFFWIIPDTWGSYWSAESDTWESYKSQISMFIAFVGSIAFVGTMENWLPKLKSHNKSNV